MSNGTLSGRLGAVRVQLYLDSLPLGPPLSTLTSLQPGIPPCLKIFSAVRHTDPPLRRGERALNSSLLSPIPPDWPQKPWSVCSLARLPTLLDDNLRHLRFHTLDIFSCQEYISFASVIPAPLAPCATASSSLTKVSAPRAPQSTPSESIS